jgi:hypothetical protein
LNQSKKQYSYFIDDNCMNIGTIKIDEDKIYLYDFIFYENCSGNLGDTVLFIAVITNDRIIFSPDRLECDFVK